MSPFCYQSGACTTLDTTKQRRAVLIVLPFVGFLASGSKCCFFLSSFCYHSGAYTTLGTNKQRRAVLIVLPFVGFLASGSKCCFFYHRFVIRVGYIQRSAQKTAKGCTYRTALCCLFGLAEVDTPLW